MPRLLISLALGVSFALPAGLSAAAPAPDPWQAGLGFDYNVAAERFESLHAQNPANARNAIAYASSLLVKQPRTDANILAARDLLVKTRETASAPVDQRVLASFLIARIELDHLSPAQPDSARARLEQLRRDHPAHPLADQAAVELAYLDAYKPSGIDATAIPRIQASLASVKSPGASRDLHMILAGLHLRLHNDSAAALPHYLAARAVGFEQPVRNAEADLSIANLARETGDTDLARTHYHAFLKSAPRDVRATTVRRLLAQIDTPAAPAAR